MKNNNNDWLDSILKPIQPTTPEFQKQLILSAIKERLPKQKKRAVGYPVNEGLEIYKEGYNTATRDTLKALGIEET